MTTPKRALQIGWRYRGTAALRRLGYDVDVIIDAESWDWYARPDWPEGIANALFIENYNWSEHLAFRLGQLIRSGRRYDAVVGFDEFSLMPSWQAANILGLPAFDWRVVSNMRDKSAQKAALHAGGVPCAKWWLIEDIRRQRDEALALSRHLPLVLKPYSGAGTVRTFVAHSIPQLLTAIDRLAASPSRTVMIESYVSGTEHHADGVVRDGNIYTFSLGEYLGNLIRISEGLTPASIVVSQATEPQAYQAAKELVSRALSILGLRNGVFHVELFHTLDGWVFSEAAMRVGGGGISLHHEVTGAIDLHESMARVQVGLPLQTGHGVAETASPVTGWTFLPGPVGLIRGFPSREEILRQEGVLDVEFDIHHGQKLGPGTADTVARVGSAILSAATRLEFLNLQQNLVNWFRSKVEVGGTIEHAAIL
jgi:hypothetical protein